MFRFSQFSVVATVVFMSSGSAVFAQARNASWDAGTVIPVKLDRTISSKENRTGDKFTAVVSADKDGYATLPEGSVIEGTIREAKAKEGNNPGMLDLAFNRVRLPDGRAYSISGALIGLDEKSVEKGDNGVLVAKGKSKNNRLTYLGYGAGAGALASIIGGGKFHLENVFLGAGLGYLAGSLEKNRQQPNDVTLKEGSKLGVRLDRRLTLTSSRTRTGDYSNRENGATGKDRPRTNNDGSSNLDRPRSHNGDDSNTRTDSGIGVIVNDQDVSFGNNATPITSGGVRMVPVRPVIDSLGASLQVSNNSNTIESIYNGKRVKVTLGSRIAIVNGSRRVSMGGQAKRINGTTYVPVQYFDLLTGSASEWDSSTQTVVISGKR